MVPPVGIEPTTRGFSVLCSTNWATEAKKIKWRPGTGSNRRPLAWQASVLTNWTTGPYGGNNRARTCDPLLVRQMLSQLSYAPIHRHFIFAFPTYWPRTFAIISQFFKNASVFLNFFQIFWNYFLNEILLYYLVFFIKPVQQIRICGAVLCYTII